MINFRSAKNTLKNFDTYFFSLANISVIYGQIDAANGTVGLV